MTSIELLHQAVRDYVLSETERTGRAPDVEIIYSNRPRYRTRVKVLGTTVAEAQDISEEGATRRALDDFRRWLGTWGSGQRRAS